MFGQSLSQNVSVEFSQLPAFQELLKWENFEIGITPQSSFDLRSCTDSYLPLYSENVHQILGSLCKWEAKRARDNAEGCS